MITHNNPPVGNLETLYTDAKENAIAAINEVWLLTDAIEASVGDVAQLPTTTKENVVAALIEMDDRISTIIASPNDENSELVDARNGAATLGERLDDMEASIFNVRHYGAVGDGVTNDATAIGACVTAAKAAVVSGAAAPVVWFPAGGRYYTTGQIDIGPSVSLRMESPVSYGGSTWPAIVLGESASYANNKNHTIWLERSTITDWTADSGEAIIGVRAYNHYSSRVRLTQIIGFSIGFQAYGTGKGFAYNEISIGRMIDNKVQIDLDCTTTGGWVNENLWLGGSFTNRGAENLNVIGTNNANNVIGVRVGKSNLYACNKNTFVKPSFELGQSALTGGARAIPVWVFRGNSNYFRDCRCENTHATALMITEGTNTSHNLFESSNGYNLLSATVEDNTVYSSNVAIRPAVENLLPTAPLVFDSGMVYLTAAHYDGHATTPKMHVPGMMWISSVSTLTMAAALSGADVYDTYLNIPSSLGLGVWVDTSTFKRFAVICDVASVGSSAVNVLCVDGSGTVLAGTAPQYANLTDIQYSSQYRAAFGNSYYRQDASTPRIWRVGASVQKAFVFVSYAQLRRMQIYALPYNATGVFGPMRTWVDYEAIVPGANIGTAAPTKTTTSKTGNAWSAGRIIYNAAPAAGGTIGWVCVTSGTPGTWKAFGTIAA